MPGDLRPSIVVARFCIGGAGQNSASRYRMGRPAPPESPVNAYSVSRTSSPDDAADGLGSITSRSKLYSQQQGKRRCLLTKRPFPSSLIAFLAIVAAAAGLVEERQE
ncbi:hypothetical protein LZ554_001792 [Drepanopeziza brunnea f. sp. 'monogermtubi']|nr:hypothetical protein LZ554_001792 [Drepanopeziza brunnea f. sp. 'monogermtubi']